MTGPFDLMRDDAVVTTGQVARAFGVNATTVHRWVRQGKLPFFRTLGGQNRFYAGDVRRLLEQGKDRR